jgi:hypothetical protein
MGIFLTGEEIMLDTFGAGECGAVLTGNLPAENGGIGIGTNGTKVGLFLGTFGFLGGGGRGDRGGGRVIRKRSSGGHDYKLGVRQEERFRLGQF